MTTAILFDFDGTLVDSLDIAIRAYARVGPRLGCAALGRADLERLRAMHALEVVEALGLPLHRLPQLATGMRRAMRDDLMETHPVEGIPEALEVLSGRGHHLGVLSSNAGSSVREYVRRHRLPGLRTIVGGTGLFGKAHALRKQARRRGLAAERLLYVGDELRDLEAARDAGARFAAVGWGFTHPDRLAAGAPDFQCSHPTDLLHIEPWIHDEARP